MTRLAIIVLLVVAGVLLLSGWADEPVFGDGIATQDDLWRSISACDDRGSPTAT